MDLPAEREIVQRRFRQQQVVADLGQEALQSDDPDRLMREACAAVAETLEVEYAKVLEVRSDEATLRQGVGWQTGAVGEATVPLEADSQAGYTLCSAGPVVVDDLRSEPRFAGPDLLVDHDVVSGISVLIGSVSQPWGVFGVHTTKRREFADHDVNFVQSVANVLGAAVEEATTKRRLRERERQFSTLIDNIPGVVYRCENEPSRAMEFVSNGARKLTGHDPEAFERDELRWGEDVQIEGDQRAVWEEIRDSVAEREPYHVSYRIETASGRRRWVTDHGQAVVDERGDLEALEGVIFDVTEKRQLEGEFEEVYGRIADGFIAVTDEWEFAHVNDHAAEILDADAEELEGTVLWEAFPGIAGTEFGARYREAIESQEPLAFEAYYDEHGRWYGERVYPSETGLSIYFRDITDRKEREAEHARMVWDVQESEERLRLALEAGEMGMWELDLQTEESPVRSARHDRLFGYEEPIEEWDLETFFEHVHPDDREEVERRFERAFETGTWEFECRIERADGTKRVIAAQGEFTFGEEDEPVRAVGIVRDVTDRIEHERKLEELIERLEESNERLEQFAYAASHDLQEPLRMVTSYLSLVESRYGDRLDDDGEEFLEYAIDGADRMRAMIDDLLEYSKVERQGDPLEPVELDEIVEAAISNLQVKIDETDAKITAEPLPRVLGDRRQLERVFQNLLGNALEYTDDESPRIHVAADSDGGTWTVSVRDEGIGIDGDNSDRVFEVFKRLHGREEHEGTGIGLALCQRIVERHGGEIWIDSEPGEGTTVSFTLPGA